MGTELERRGSDTSLPLWSARALLKEPDLVYQIHSDYIKVGADIITTNTFRTQEWVLSKSGFSSTKARELTTLAVDLARESRQTHGSCFIAGSIPPLEDCYFPDLVPANSILVQEHTKHISNLADAGIDIFLIETMNSFREAKIAFEITQEYPDIPVIVSFTCDNTGNVLNQDAWSEIINFFKDKVAVISTNCSTIEGTGNAIKQLNQNNINNIGFYPNFGKIENNIWSREENKDNYYDHIHQWVESKPTLVGTCCGATPEDTQNLSTYLKKIGLRK